MKDAACELTEAQFLVALAVEATTAGAAGAVTFSAKLLSTSSPARPQPVADLGACPSSRARSKIEESFSLRPFSHPPSLVLRSTTGAIRGRCEEAVLGRIESHSLLFNRVALLGRTPRSCTRPKLTSERESSSRPVRRRLIVSAIRTWGLAGHKSICTSDLYLSC